MKKMSKLTDDWRAIRQKMGFLIGRIETLAAKYERMSDIEEEASAKGYGRGLQEGLARNKQELCQSCRFMESYNNSQKYSWLIDDYAKLSADKQDIIDDLLEKLLDLD